MEFCFMKNEYLKIGYRASKKYRSILGDHDIESCIYNGIHDALMNYDEKAGSKLSTFIYNNVRYNCLNLMKEKNKNKNLYDVHECKSYHYEPKFDPSFTEILIDRLVYNIPISQLCQKYNMTRREVLNTIKKRKNILINMVKAKENF